MASFSSPSRYLLAFLLLNVYLKALEADSDLSFYFKNFGKGSSFEPKLALYGDAKVENDSSSIQISGGRVVSKKPFRVVSNSSQMVSFSSYFVFSMSGKDGSALAFVMFPLDFPLNAFASGLMGLSGDGKRKVLAVEFDTFKEGKGVESLVLSVNVRNQSSIHLKLNDGEKLQAWIDYEASSKRFEVRLSKLSDNRPLNPLLNYPIDLSKLWKENEFLAGLSSPSQNSSHCNIYSWSFKSRTTPHWMHSQPMDPQHLPEKGEELKVVPPKRSDCALKIAVALIFGMGCGAMGAISILFLWAVLGNRRPVVPEGIHDRTDELEYKKFEVVADKPIEDGKK